MKVENMGKLYDRAMILRCLKGIEAATPVGAHRRELWDRCWSDTGTPDYFSDIMRLNGEFWLAPGAELAYLNELRADLAAKYLDGIDTVHEFGCGGGQNLKALQAMGKHVVGYDWSKAAAARIDAMGGRGVVYDMFYPQPVEIRGAALTVHALEQLGDRWLPFLSMLIAARPSVVIHVEPVEELYDPENLLDYLALAYHRKRGYLSGYLTHLRKLAGMGVIDLVEQRRNRVGSLYHEAYSVIVWRVI